MRLVRCAAISVDSAQKIAAGIKKELAGMAVVELIDQRVITVDGVHTARLEHTLVATGQAPIRQLQYWLPTGTQCAVATYSASPDQWDLYRPIFEKSAQATRGLHAPSLGLDTGRIFDAAWKGGVKWGLIGGGLGLLFGVGDWPEGEVDSIPIIGEVLAIDYTAVAALKPDLILASRNVPGMEKVVPKLAGLGFPMVVYDPETWADVLEDLEDALDLQTGHNTSLLKPTGASPSSRSVPRTSR